MRRIRKNTGLWNYLNGTGLLEADDKVAIEQAKKVYWRNYNTAYKRKKRQQHRMFSISMTGREAQELRIKASHKGFETPKYIKACIQADLENTYVVPHPYILREIEQLLLNYINTLKDISNRDMKGWFTSNRNYTALEEVIHNIEQTVISKFRQAPQLEVLIEQTLQQNPQFIIKLKSLIKKYHDC